MLFRRRIGPSSLPSLDHGYFRVVSAPGVYLSVQLDTPTASLVVTVFAAFSLSMFFYCIWCCFTSRPPRTKGGAFRCTAIPKRPTPRTAVSVVFCRPVAPESSRQLDHLHLLFRPAWRPWAATIVRSSAHSMASVVIVVVGSFLPSASQRPFPADRFLLPTSNMSCSHPLPNRPTSPALCRGKTQTILHASRASSVFGSSPQSSRRAPPAR